MIKGFLLILESFPSVLTDGEQGNPEPELASLLLGDGAGRAKAADIQQCMWTEVLCRCACG